MNQNPSMPKREFALDLLRVMACFLVVWQHVTECYYINPDMSVPSHDEMPLIGWMNSMTPIEVPLFVMVSGYFLLPMKMDITAFFKRRFTRILIPFVVWCVAYSAYFMAYRGDTLAQFFRNLAHIPVNLGVEIGHMWLSICSSVCICLYRSFHLGSNNAPSASCKVILGYGHSQPSCLTFIFGFPKCWVNVSGILHRCFITLRDLRGISCWAITSSGMVPCRYAIRCYC